MRLELLVDRAIAQLKAHLPGRIAELNTITGDFDLEPPDPDAGYHYGVQREIYAYPAVEVAVPDLDLLSLSLGQAAADTRPVLVAAIWYQHVSDEILWRSLDRYSHCVAQVLLTPGAFGPSVVVDALAVRTRVNPETREAEQLTGAVVHVYRLSDAELLPHG